MKRLHQILWTNAQGFINGNEIVFPGKRGGPIVIPIQAASALIVPPEDRDSALALLREAKFQPQGGQSLETFVQAGTTWPSQV